MILYVGMSARMQGYEFRDTRGGGASAVKGFWVKAFRLVW